MIHYEMEATGLTGLTRPLYDGSGALSCVGAAEKLMKARVDCCIYLVKALLDCDDGEWPFVTGSHVARASLERSFDCFFV